VTDEERRAAVEEFLEHAERSGWRLYNGAEEVEIDGYSVVRASPPAIDRAIAEWLRYRIPSERIPS
jgi:hypothetical protein